MQFHGLSPFGIGTFDNAPTPAQTAYEAILEAYGPLGDRDVTTYYGSRHFAKAILVGVVRRHIERAACQQHPLSVKDKISSLERDWGLTPPPTADLNQRQLALAAQMLLMTGAKQIAIETALRAVLGDDFISLRVTQPSERVLTPTDPTTQGTFDPPGTAPIYLRVNDSVVVGTNTLLNATLLGDSLPPLVGAKLTIDPADANRTEVITILDARAGIDNDCGITFVAGGPHNPGTIAASCMPMWRSNQRHVAVLVTPGSITPELARQVNQVMQRHMKSVTDWSIVAATPLGLTGPWIVAEGIVGETALGDTAG